MLANITTDVDLIVKVFPFTRKYTLFIILDFHN